MTTELTFQAPVADLIVPTKAPETSVVVSGILLAEVDRIHAAMGAAPTITDQASMDAVRQVMKQASGLRTKIESARQVAKAPFLTIGTTIDEAAKKVSARLDEVVTEAKKQIEDFLIERDRQLREAERVRRAAEAAAQAAQAAAIAAGQPTRPTAALVTTAPLPEAISAPTQQVREVVIFDESLLPREYLAPIMAKIRADALAGKLIPGVRVDHAVKVVAR